MPLGRSLPAVAVTAMLLSAAPHASRAGADPRVANLIAESGAALNVAALKSIRTLHARGSLVASGLSGTGDTWNEMGGVREAARFSTPPLGGGSGWDGNLSWTLDQTGLVIVDGSVLGISSAVNQAYFTNDDLWTPGYGGASVAWGGSRVEKGETFDVLTVTPPKSSVPIDVFFDRSTHLPVKAVQTAGPLVTTISMANFKPVDGLMIPYRLDTSNNAGSTSSFTATSVEANPPGGEGPLAVPTSSPHDFSIAHGAQQASVPVQISESHVYLDVLLDGKGPFHFEFDTGGANVVDSSVAEALGAASGGFSQVTGVGSSSAASSFATIQTLQIGNARVSNQVFITLPIAKSLAKVHGMRLDGFIGYEVLSRFVTTFDYADKRVVFRLPGAFTPAPGATVIPIVQYGTQPQFDCRIDDVPATCTLDTGARDSISLFTPFVEAHPSVVPATLTAPGVNGFGVGGPHIGRLGRVRTLCIGGLTLHDLVGDYSTKGTGSLAMPFIGANIGGAVWKRFTMTLDYRRLTMTLTPNAAFSLPEHWDRSGLFLLDNGAMTIVDVRPGTPAARVGLEKGDVILSLDGSSKLSLNALRNQFMAAPGTVEHLVVENKDGVTHSVDLTLADYV
ncbi:MAG TPA: aspartyl protease family protein [Candidatus Acidoferrales bacterium]|nr:aspartyl protease family protein [Candidatus Acidoferrales bacterium]